MVVVLILNASVLQVVELAAEAAVLFLTIQTANLAIDVMGYATAFRTGNNLRH